MTPTTATPFLSRWILLSLAVSLLVFAAVFLPGALSADWNPFSAQSGDGSEVPAKPTGLSVATEQGSLNVSADWDDVEGADDYLVRWRPNGERLNEGVRTQSSSATITVAAYGEWVVRVQACNEAGCGKPTSERFSVEPAPEPTPTPTPIIPNKPPVFDRNNIRFHTVLENYGPWITAGTYVVRDPENDQITVSLAGADAASFSTRLFPWGNELSIGLDLNATPDYESPADANGDGVYEVTIRATDADGSGETTELDVTVTVLDVDEAPVITGPAGVSLAEHSGTGVGQYSAADPEGGTATLTLGGTDAASFTFADGTLTFNAAPDYETQDSYSVTLTASDGTNTSTLGVTITITDVDETTTNFGPVVDDQAERYQGFTGTDNAPRGTLVSKVYDGIFSDPNSDELTYTVSVPADRSGLVDTVYVSESTQRVFIRLDAEDDWGAVTPALPKPLVTTVTLTATDPGGLSASVTGEFQTNWEAAPAPTVLSVCDRTPQVRDVLVKLLGKNCENIGAKDLARVVKLDLSNKGLRSLRSGDFSGMSSLRSVDVSSNTFTQWSDVCGDGRWGDSVTDINLNNNKTIGGTGAALPGNCFVGAPNLKTLHLAGTRINSLPANAFGDTGSRLTDLWWLDLSRNQIATLNVDVFDGLSNLWYLDLGRNALTKSGLPASETGGVKTSVFDDLSSLEWLALNNQFEQDPSNNFDPKTTAQLTELDANVFTGLSSLKELDLANNGLTSSGSTALPNDVFKPLSSLESLALFGNPGAPWTTTQLTALGITNADVLQVVTPPSGFEIEPVSSGVKLTWDDPSDSNMSHQYRHMVADSDDWTAWTAISSPTTSGTKLEHTVSSDLSSGKNYVFQLRSVKSGANSWRANADCSALFGTSSNDTLTGSLDADCILGLAGDDTLEGRGGADKLDGGAGTDTASYAGSPTGVEVDLTISTAQAQVSNSDADRDVLSNIENITGTAYPDTLTGDSSANTLTGGAGDDTLVGLAGGDTLNCGDGVDTLSYASSNAGVTVKLFENTASGGHAGSDTISNCENLTGSTHADTLAGDGNVNVLKGGAGADALTGRGGDDVITGGTGADAMNGGPGTDTLIYTGSSAAVTVRLHNNTASGGDAQGDTISNFENITGSAHDDSLDGSTGSNTLEGGAGDDTLNGNHGNDVIEGGAGSDTLNGGVGTDTLSYESSTLDVNVNIFDNTASLGDAQGDTISNFENIIGSNFQELGSYWEDHLTGTDNANVLTGLDGDDDLIGRDGDDTLNGGLGMDRLEGGAGADILNGGPTYDPGHFYTGNLDASNYGDRVLYFDAPAAVTVNLATGQGSRGHAQGDTYTNIEGVSGSNHDDIIIGDEGENWLEGYGGADAIDGRGGFDVAVYFYDLSKAGIVLDLATPANNTGHATGDTFTNIEMYIGTNFADTMTGDANDNIFHGYTGHDTITGNDGNDILYGGFGDDTLTGNRDDDELYGGSNNDELYGGFGDDLLDGGHGIDDIQGQEGNDRLYGSHQPDKLSGGDGDDYLEGGKHADKLDCGAGNDTVSYASSETDAAVTVTINGAASGGDAAGDTFPNTNCENIIGSAYDDTLTGDANANVIEGGAGADTLNGAAGSDTLSYAGSSAGVTVTINGTASGGDAQGDTISNFQSITGSAHNDSLTGDSNANRLDGGAGADTLLGGAGVDALVGRSGNDTLSGGEGNDILVGGTGTDEFIFYDSFGNDSMTDYASSEKIWICIGSGKGTGNGQVNWSSAASGGNWKITVTSKDNSGNDVSDGVITLVSVTSDPGSNIAWSDPTGATCNI